MLGLGETDAEVRSALADLLEAGVRAVTLGQYLRPGLG
jgi:lipoic acid synthetase